MEILSNIKGNREQLLSGNIQCIPLPFEGSRRAYSGISPGQLTCITAETSVGKTSLAKYMYVFSVIDSILALKENEKLEYKCIWFGLEESEKEFDISIIQYALSKFYQVYVTQDELLSKLKPLDANIIRLIETTQVQDYFNFCKEIVFFDEDSATPTEIFNACTAFGERYGFYENDRYIPNNPNIIITVVIDNVNILEPEKNKLGLPMDLSGCIDIMVNTYARKEITKKWGWHVCCLHQQQMAAGDLAHFKAGKLEPEPQKLGDNIKVARSYQVIFGLFSPQKHNLSSDEKYPILSNHLVEGFEDCYRKFHICKNRFGKSSIKEALFFNPKGFSFFKLPPPDSDELTEFMEFKRKIVF
jgi:hypothetical protein